MFQLGSNGEVPADPQLLQVQLLGDLQQLADLASLDDCCCHFPHHDLGCCCCSGDLEVGSCWVLDLQDDDDGDGSCGRGWSEHGDGREEELGADLPDSEMEADDGGDGRMEAEEEGAGGRVRAASFCDCCLEAGESC